MSKLKVTFFGDGFTHGNPPTSIQLETVAEMSPITTTARDNRDQSQGYSKSENTRMIGGHNMRRLRSYKNQLLHPGECTGVSQATLGPFVQL